jgi:NitT/TauT family transport system substrate-binding protein
VRRRDFLRGAAAGAASLIGRPRTGAAEPPPETTRIRLHQIPGICIAPQYLAEELLRIEGFKDVQYLQIPGSDPHRTLANGDLDVIMAFVAPFLVQVDAGLPIVLLGGIHVGCYEVFGTDQVRAIRDLKGRRVAVPAIGSGHHAFLASMVTYVGLNPQRDIQWAIHSPEESAALLAEGRVDALVGFPPVPQELRARRIGHVIVNSAVDRPWSQYFCCLVAGNREFVRRHPGATKRVLRAFLKASDLCALEPDRAARLLVDRGFTREYGYALQTMKEISYNRWRTYDPEDSARFYALRLHEAGMIKSSPQKILAQGTDWRFFNELKKELKG